MQSKFYLRIRYFASFLIYTSRLLATILTSTTQHHKLSTAQLSSSPLQVKPPRYRENPDHQLNYVQENPSLQKIPPSYQPSQNRKKKRSIDTHYCLGSVMLERVMASCLYLPPSTSAKVFALANAQRIEVSSQIETKKKKKKTQRKICTFVVSLMSINCPASPVRHSQSQFTRSLQ